MNTGTNTHWVTAPLVERAEITQPEARGADSRGMNARVARAAGEGNAQAGLRTGERVAVERGAP